MSIRRSPHRPALIAEVRELAAAGWGPGYIARLLARRGTPVCEATIRSWTVADPERRREDQRRADARRNARISGGRLRGQGPRKTPEFKQARIEGLRAAGLSHRAIAAVMRFDELEPTLTANQVRRRLTGKEKR